MKKTIVLLMVLALTALMLGCAKEKSMDSQQEEAESMSQEVVIDNEEDVLDEKTLASYAELIGMSRESVITKMNEEPTVVDEGGLEFEQGGFRAWFFGDDGTLDQLYFFDDNIDFNGVKLGGTIEEFKQVFGEPEVSDAESLYMNFAYEGYILNVYFDEASVVHSVYLLKNWE